MNQKFEKISVDQTQQQSKAAKRFPNAEITIETPKTTDHQAGKKHLHLSAKKGNAFDVCATMNPKYICCNFHVLRALSNCPCSCSYCFLQYYLTNKTTSVVVDTAALIDEVKEKSALQPWRFFRIGTWELGDSLALETITGTAAELIVEFSKLENVMLELRTKRDAVESILDLPHGGRTAIGMTLNPQEVITADEHGTASLTQRLEAMKKASDAGYLISLHFDPMVLFEGWQEAYRDLVKRVFQTVPAKRIAWISVSSLRFDSEMKRLLEERYPASRLTCKEMVAGDDGKLRYIRPKRTEMYQHICDAIRHYGDDRIFIYLCMERWNVWEKVFGKSPESIGHLEYLITESLFKRFPGLITQKPEYEKYSP